MIRIFHKNMFIRMNMFIPSRQLAIHIFCIHNYESMVDSYTEICCEAKIKNMQKATTGSKKYRFFLLTQTPPPPQKWPGWKK